MRISQLALILLVACTPALFAVETPTHDVPKQCAEPCGGTLFLFGGDTLPDELAQRFLKFAGGDEGKLVILTTGDPPAEAVAAELEMRWRARTKATITFLHANSVQEVSQADFFAPLRTATGVWLGANDGDRVLATYANTKLQEELRAALSRGAAVGGNMAVARTLGEIVLTNGTSEELEAVTGLSILNNTIIERAVADGENRLLKLLGEYPGRVGFEIADTAALVVRGREMSVLGSSTVSIQLAPSQTRPARTSTLKAGEFEDLTALRRAAIARAGQPFPETTPKPVQVLQGSLVIVGGGRLPMVVRKKFLELSGGPDAKIVVIPVANNVPQSGVDQNRWLKDLGAKNLVVFDPPNRAAADSAEFLAQLKDAGGIWFGGGRQWRTVDEFEGTACIAAFHDVLRRGGAIGGSSAGATIQGEYLVRGSPIKNTIMMAEGYERGFAFLPGSAIDQHFTQRKRQPDMVQLKQTFPQLLGLGIDEGTAVVVHGTSMDVLGEATVSIYPPNAVSDGQPAEPRILKAGETFDLRQLSDGSLQAGDGR